MRASDFLTESEQLEMDALTEGPLGSLAKGIGKAAGGLAKGVGAVAGGVAGLGSAFKKGYQSGKATVSGDEVPAAAQPTAQQPAAQQPNQPADTTKTATGTAAAGSTADTTDAGATDAGATAAGTKPAASTTTNTTVNAPSTASATTQATAADPNATPKPTMIPDQPAADTADKGKETEYSKALKFVKGLPVNKQKDIINMLQKNPKVVAAMNKAGSKPAAEPSASATTADQPTADQPPEGMPAGRFGQEMGRLAKPLAGTDSETPGAAVSQKAGSRPQGGGRVAGQLSTDPRAVKRREQRAAKKADGAAQPDLTDPNVPISAAIRQRQRQGLAAGYRNPDKMIREGFSLFRKQQ